MTDPDYHAPAPELPAPRPRRAATFFGRLSRALGEQNWLAAGIELAIVVLGVVIGFQITAWGQTRSDRAKEETYLLQLVADLQESERGFADAEQRVAFADEGRARLFHAFWAPDAAPRDSVLYWADVWRSTWTPAPCWARSRRSCRRAIST